MEIRVTLTSLNTSISLSVLVRGDIPEITWTIIFLVFNIVGLMELGKLGFAIITTMLF